MRKITLFLLASLLVYASAFSQNTVDKLFKHSGETLNVKIVKVAEFTVVYKYPGEDAEQTISKNAVSKITYASGRSEDISEKIVISDKGDWEKVQILTDKVQVVGLKKGDEVRGKTSGFLSYNSAGSADKKATKKLKEAAAEMGAPFILLTGDKSDGYGIKQAMKNGTVYTYK